MKKLILFFALAGGLLAFAGTPKQHVASKAGINPMVYQDTVPNKKKDTTNRDTTHRLPPDSLQHR